MSMFDKLRDKRFIAANTLAGLSLAALSGCGTIGDSSPESRIDRSYSQAFIDKDDTECFPETINHPSAIYDLKDALMTNEKLDIDQLHGAYNAGSNIQTILTAMHEQEGHSTDSTGNYHIQPGDTYEYCVNDDTGEIQPGNPADFSVIG